MLYLFALLSLVSFAQTDQELDTYIRQFELVPQNAAPAKRVALFQLGKELFNDKQLSGKENISCATCHSLYSADTLTLGLGEGAEGLNHSRHQSQGAILPRNTPGLFNLGLPGITSYFWDGRVSDDFKGGWITPEPTLGQIAKNFDSLLAVQAIFPLSNPDEMLGKESKLTNAEAWQNIMDKLNASTLYQRLFKLAYPGVSTFNIAHVGNAIAEFERHEFLANATPWDLYMRGRKEYLNARARKGAKIFISKANCIFCHTGPHLSTFGFQNVGVPQIGPGFNQRDDKGKFENRPSQLFMYAFRVAPLRNVALTAPYMHTGAFKTLWEVIEHYNHPMSSVDSFKWNPGLPSYREDLVLNTDPTVLAKKAKTMSGGLLRDIKLSQEEKTDLYCFLAVGLTDVKYQADLLSKKLIDEIEDCAPVR